MAKKGRSNKAQTPLAFDKQNCVLGKYSNNLQKWGDKDVPAWTVPITGLALNREQLNKLMGPFTFESWFNQKAKDGVYEPMDFWQHRSGGDIKINDEFDIPNLEILCSGNRKAKFRAEELEDEEEPQSRPGARITAIVLKPVVGGIVEMACHLHVLPGGPETAENQLLQEHQRRPVKISFSSATLAEADPKQPELPMAHGEGEKSATNGNGMQDESAALIHKAFEEAAPGPNEKPSRPGDVVDFEAGARKKVAEHANKSPRGGRSAPRPGRGH